jgi:hypothetical protein
LLDMNSFLVPRIQGCVWEEKCRHIAQTLTIWLCHWSCGRKATSIQTHLQFVKRWTYKTSWIHRWEFEKEGLLDIPKLQLLPLCPLLKKKMALYKCVLIMVD